MPHPAHLQIYCMRKPAAAPIALLAEGLGHAAASCQPIPDGRIPRLTKSRGIHVSFT